MSMEHGYGTWVWNMGMEHGYGTLWVWNTKTWSYIYMEHYEMWVWRGVALIHEGGGGGDSKNSV